MTKEDILKEIDKLDVKLTEEQLKKLEIYAEYLLEYNKHTNLTAIKDIENVYLKHFYDSLTLVKAVDLNNISNMVDIGTGAGFPGMVIKIAFPHIKMTLIDSNNKKIKFLNELIKKLDLKEVDAINIRSEDFAHDNLEKYDLVTARAVSAMPILTEISLPLVKIGGYFVPLKSTVKEELEDAKFILEKLNGLVEEIIEFSLPYEESLRNIVKIRKTDSTPKGYPRSYDKIKKSLKNLRK